eukprot:EG_transcript_25112
MSLGDFLGPPQPTEHSVEVEEAPLSADPLLKYSSYFTNEGDCHGYYAGDELWDKLVQDQDWTRVTAMYNHIALIFERDRERSTSVGRWGTHPTFMQLLLKLWERLRWMLDQGVLTPECKQASRRLFDAVNLELTFKQTSKIPKWGSLDLMATSTA